MTKKVWKDLKGKAQKTGELRESVKEHFTTVLIHATSGDIPPLVDDITDHHNTGIRNALPSSDEIIFLINTVKRNKGVSLDVLPEEVSVSPANLRSLQDW